MDVRFHHEARLEFNGLPDAEKRAMQHAIDLLAVFGDGIDERFSSDVRGADAPLRELRPRAGRSPWRAFYRRIGGVMYVGAFGPEARVDPPGFRRAVRAAVGRLARVERREER